MILLAGKKDGSHFSVCFAKVAPVPNFPEQKELAEQIIPKLREVEVEVRRGKSGAEAADPDADGWQSWTSSIGTSHTGLVCWTAKPYPRPQCYSWGRALPPISVFAMGNHHDDNAMSVVANFIDDAVVSDANPPRIPTRKLLAGAWARLLGKTLQHGKHSLLLIGREFLENLLC